MSPPATSLRPAGSGSLDGVAGLNGNNEADPLAFAKSHNSDVLLGGTPNDVNTRILTLLAEESTPEASQTIGKLSMTCKSMAQAGASFRNQLVNKPPPEDPALRKMYISKLAELDENAIQEALEKLDIMEVVSILIETADHSNQQLAALGRIVGEKIHSLDENAIPKALEKLDIMEVLSIESKTKGKPNQQLAALGRIVGEKINSIQNELTSNWDNIDSYTDTSKLMKSAIEMAHEIREAQDRELFEALDDYSDLGW